MVHGRCYARQTESTTNLFYLSFRSAKVYNRAMRRRDFIQAAGAAAFLLSARGRAAAVHNFDGYDFGPGPPVSDRLYQGPFPTDQFAGWQVVMATTASTDVVRGYGMGLITYLCDEVGPPAKPGESLA